MLNIRQLTTNDLDTADAILTAAYKSTRSWQHDLSRFLALQPDGWLLAEYRGEPVGMAGATDYGTFAHVGLVGVLPDHQRHGVGASLMRVLLEWLDARGCQVAALDASVAGVPLYERLGFVDEFHTLVYTRDNPASNPPISDLVVPMRSQDIAELAAFDAPIFGASRAHVLATYQSEFLGRAYLTRDTSGRITGYLFAQDHLLGPWVAQSEDVAEGLLASALALDFSAAPGATVPGLNAMAGNLLSRYGFSSQRALRHMRLGGLAAPGNHTMLFGQANLAIG